MPKLSDVADAVFRCISVTTLGLSITTILIAMHSIHESHYMNGRDCKFLPEPYICNTNYHDGLNIFRVANTTTACVFPDARTDPDDHDMTEYLSRDMECYLNVPDAYFERCDKFLTTYRYHYSTDVNGNKCPIATLRVSYGEELTEKMVWMVGWGVVFSAVSFVIMCLLHLFSQ